MTAPGSGPAPAEQARAARPTVAGLAAAIVALLLIGTVVVTLPGPSAITGTTPVAQLVALRGLVGLLAAIGALVAVAVWLAARRGAPALARAAITAALVLLLVVGAQLAVLVSRGTTGMAGPDPAPMDGDLVVLALNTQGAIAPEELAAFVAGRGADVVSLPETDPGTARRTVDLLAGEGEEYELFLSTTGHPVPTALLVSAALGGYRFTEHGPGSSIVVDGPGPTIVAAHTWAPAGSELKRFRASTAWAVTACATTPGAIVVGDLNSTLDHPAFAGLDGCVDAGEQADVAGVGTWPTMLPRWLGAPIDHVLVDAGTWRVVRAAVLEPPAGTDHRAFEAVLEHR